MLHPKRGTEEPPTNHQLTQRPPFIETNNGALRSERCFRRKQVGSEARGCCSALLFPRCCSPGAQQAAAPPAGRIRSAPGLSRKGVPCCGQLLLGPSRSGDRHHRAPRRAGRLRSSAWGRGERGQRRARTGRPRQPDIRPVRVPRTAVRWKSPMRSWRTVPTMCRDGATPVRHARFAQMADPPGRPRASWLLPVSGLRAPNRRR
jgi:hypothetical protein